MTRLNLQDARFPVRAIAADVAVAPQLAPEDMQEVARLGFRSIVNNRPDFEFDRVQPTHANLQQAAEAAGLNYRFLPVSGGWQSPQQIQAFAELLQTLPRPLLAFCRSGARSGQLYLKAIEGLE